MRVEHSMCASDVRPDTTTKSGAAAKVAVSLTWHDLELDFIDTIFNATMICKVNVKSYVAVKVCYRIRKRLRRNAF